MIEAFKVIRFKPATLSRIGHANEIIGEYQALGFTLTLRQLFYHSFRAQRLASPTHSTTTRNWGGPSPTRAGPV